FFFQAEDGIRDRNVTGVQTCALPISITSRKEAGIPVAEVFPSLRGAVAISYSDPLKSDLAKCDVVFFATPNTVAMGEARALVERSEERRVGKECRDGGGRW